MTYGLYEGFRIVAKGLRSLDRHVAILGALASRFHEYNATGLFDGTLSGFWNFAFEPMLDHLEAWRRRDLDAACRIWNGGLVQLHEYVADMGRLHVRYQTATWLRGLIPNPFMRPPMPRPRQIEIDTIYELLKNLGLSVIDRTDAVIEKSVTAAFEK
jgi:dihydrodipicolinate synthase/N-acetylneuraminate lyase